MKIGDKLLLRPSDLLQRLNFEATITDIRGGLVLLSALVTVDEGHINKNFKTISDFTTTTSMSPPPPKPKALTLQVGSLVKCKPGTPGPNNLSGRFGYVKEVAGNSFGIDNAKVEFADFTQWVNPDFLEVRESIG